MLSIGSGKLLIGCVAGLLVLGGATLGLGIGGFADVPADSETTVGEDELEIRAVQTPTEIRPDEPLRVQLRLTNAGSETTTKQVALQLSGDGDQQSLETVATKQVEVSAAEPTNVTLTVEPEQLSSGEYTYAVAVGESSSPETTGSVAVLTPPTFVLDDTTENATIVRGTNVSIRANLTNAGAYRGVQTVRIAVDEDQNGQYTDAERLDESVYSLAGGQSQVSTATAHTTDMEPGRYQYKIATENTTATGTLSVQQPATFRVQNTTAPVNVTKGETANVSVVVKNVGDVDGTDNVTIRSDSLNTTYSRSVSLAANETTTVSIGVNTTNLSSGTHNHSLGTSTDTDPVSMTVQDSHFEVSDLDGPNVLYVGDMAVFSADVTNTGNITGTQSIQHRIDSDDDDRPEAYGVDRNVTLAPGESTRVRFEIDYTVTDSTEYPVEPLRLQTYVHGIYSEDARASTAMSVKPSWAKDGGSSSYSGSTSVSEGDRASLDEITQDKYGRHYDEVSGETKRQVEEIHERQPFADGLAAAEVRTREEIARQEYDADVKAGEKFNFTGLDIETQQKVESDFDAQFETDSGDRIESWDELANDTYETSYENLTTSRQADIRTTYQDQFE
ncbi:unknown (plasmid) [Haloarcula marismortui ATCC 43049]|uniref:CARDB domain-containing protein n=1 Tax=Haloarcula marismortui (strain ATCC 43049 / DSM 3752 / JCM 8966 / VKM B-1809) TaxID=272569 RepID=Q5V6F2_HALMA|nr:unknown [Haloarcula marismortui ATCC 43049]